MASDALESTGDDMDAVAASIAKKLGGDAQPPRVRNDQGRFVPQASGEPQNEVSPTPESGEAEEAEADEGVLPEEVEEQSDEDGEKPQTYTVKVDGQDESVTLEELVNGYSKDAAFRRKTAAFAEERKAWETKRDVDLATERQGLAGEREQAKAVLAAWTGWIETQLGNKDYWDKLRTENPGEWSAKQYELSQQLQTLQSQQSEIQQKDSQKFSAAFEQRKREEYDQLVVHRPEWRDAKKLQEAFGKMGDYATQVRGFKPEELGTVIDHRLWMVLDDAAAFHALKEKKPTIAPKLASVQPAKPGVTQSVPTSSTKLHKAHARLQKSGRIEDLAELMKHKYKLG